MRLREEALYEIAAELNYQRLGPRIREILTTDLFTAVRRGILESNGKGLRLLCRSVEDYQRDFLKEQFLASIGRTWTDRHEAIRNFARWLGYSRTGPVFQTRTRSVINGLLREQRLESDGPNLRRI